MAPVSPDAWRPVGIDRLEPAAESALRYPGSTAVIAGPGAGKTEFLAQKACYLLETNTCPDPARILAIAFKTDAAVNLRKRVEKRLPQLAGRFHSVTFDSFTKSIVDRFKAALAEPWRLSNAYELNTLIGNRRNVEVFLQNVAERNHALRPGVAGLSPNSFVPEVLGSYRLPYSLDDSSSADEFAVLSWWRDYYLEALRPTVDFTMLNRLAELIVRSSPQIQRALQLTYPYVFLDEFQDITFAQYDFLASVFDPESVIVTAVGDSKQSIMRWAGAIVDPFGELSKRYDAKFFSLGMNYRSSKALIKIQTVVARALDQNAIEAESRKPGSVAGSASQIWLFDTVSEEANKVSDWIAADIARSGRRPNDYVLLARQRAEDLEPLIAAGLGRHGIGLRNESLRIGKSTLQDLLLDDATRLCLAFVRLATTSRSAATWADTCALMCAVSGVDSGDEVAARQVSDDVSELVRELRVWLGTHPTTSKSAELLLDLLLDRIGRDSIKRAFLSYRAPDGFVIAEEALRERFSAMADASSDWTEACDQFEGVDAVPLMTVHKSKGLEYHTVVFLGIDDKMWWAHSPGGFDGLATFFVGLTRAEQRAMFTFCSGRGGRQKVDDLYRLLRQAGVSEVRL